VNSRLPLAPSLLRVTIGCLSMPIRVFSRSGHAAGFVTLRQTFVRHCHRGQAMMFALPTNRVFDPAAKFVV
jgi:hypothetical protein